jgi:hypothetical protein
MRRHDAILPAITAIERTIHLVRGVKVMLDQDLADLYGSTTKRVNEQVRRNLPRFPRDFMFQLTPVEWENLRSQFATSSSGHGGRRYLPLAFTEHGAVMLANVLNSRRAVRMSVLVVRTFVKLRELLATHEQLSRRIDALQTKYDGNFAAVFAVLGRLVRGPRVRRRRLIGFGR